jgi:hypothetical protein
MSAKRMYRDFTNAHPNIPVKATHVKNGSNPLGGNVKPLQDDGLRFYRGLLYAILPSVFIWAMLIGAVIWALHR